MRYKGEYEPSELLCPVALDWHAFKSSINYLNKNTFTPLNPSVVKEFEIMMDIDNEKLKTNEKHSKIVLGKETEKLGVMEKSEDNDNDTNKSKIITNNTNSNHTKDNPNNGKKSITNNEIIINKNDEIKEGHHNNEGKKEEQYTSALPVISPLEKMKNSILRKFAPNFNFCPPCSTSSLPQPQPQEDSSNSLEYHRIRTMHTYVASSVFENLSRVKRLDSVNEGENNHQNSVTMSGNSSALRQKIVSKESIEDMTREELSRVPLDFSGGEEYSLTFL